VSLTLRCFGYEFSPPHFFLLRANRSAILAHLLFCVLSSSRFHSPLSVPASSDFLRTVWNSHRLSVPDLVHILKDELSAGVWHHDVADSYFSLPGRQRPSIHHANPGVTPAFATIISLITLWPCSVIRTGVELWLSSFLRWTCRFYRPSATGVFFLSDLILNRVFHVVALAAFDFGRALHVPFLTLSGLFLLCQVVFALWGPVFSVLLEIE